MKGTRNKLTSASRKSGGSPGKTLHCSMDSVPGKQTLQLQPELWAAVGDWQPGRLFWVLLGSGTGSRRSSGVLTLIAQVGVCHELVNHQVHLT